MGEMADAMKLSLVTVGYEQFVQIVNRPTHDGNLIGKDYRDQLVAHGLVDRGYGFNYLTAQGVSVAVALGLLRA